MKNIVLIGMPSCGKSTVGKLLAERLGVRFFDCDSEAERECGMTVSEIFGKRGEEYFRKLETEILGRLAKESSCVISTGGGCVERPENMQAVSGCTVVFLNRSLEDICRDADISSRPLLADGVQRIREIYSRRIGLYEKYCDVEIQNNVSPQAAAEKIIAEVKKHENNGD